MIIETERLLLREYTMDDFEALYEIMSDVETMQHYPAPFDEARTRRWIEWNLENYAQYGFGLWAVVLKETGEFIGDCGITIQNIDGEKLPDTIFIKSTGDTDMQKRLRRPSGIGLLKIRNIRLCIRTVNIRTKHLSKQLKQ